jgi:hypothetical protein
MPTQILIPRTEYEHKVKEYNGINAEGGNLIWIVCLVLLVVICLVYWQLKAAKYVIQSI